MIPRRMALLVTGITIALAAVIVTVKPSLAVDDCLAGPNAVAPQGSHWYYRVDRATHRNCWYLRPQDTGVRTHAHQDGSPARPHPSNSMNAQPMSQISNEARTAEAAGPGPLAAEPLPVEMATVVAKTAEVAAESAPVEKLPSQVDDLEIDSEIEQ